MAVTNQNSTQYGNQVATPPVIAEANVDYGKLRFVKVNFTQSGAGDATSTAKLYKLPPGKVTFCAGLSQLKVSAFGATRTLHIGYESYHDQTGTVVAADNDAVDASLDVAAASIITPGGQLADGTITFTSRNGVVLSATVNVSTIPDAATIQGVLVYAVE